MKDILMFINERTRATSPQNTTTLHVNVERKHRANTRKCGRASPLVCDPPFRFRHFNMVAALSSNHV